MPRTGLRRRPARVCPRSALHRRGSAGPSRGRGGRGRGHCPGPLCALRTAALGGGLAGGALPPGTQAVVRATERLRAALVPAAGASFSTVYTLCHLHPQNAAIPGRREPTHLSTPDSAGGQDSRGAGAAGGGERPPFTWGRDSHARSAPARECPSPSAARQPQTCAPQPPQPAGAKYQRGQRDQRGTPETPESRLLPLQGQTWAEGPGRAQGRPGLGRQGPERGQARGPGRPRASPGGVSSRGRAPPDGHKHDGSPCASTAAGPRRASPGEGSLSAEPGRTGGSRGPASQDSLASAGS